MSDNAPRPEATRWEKHEFPHQFCASDDCPYSANWRMEKGGIGSYYCDECRAKIEPAQPKPEPSDEHRSHGGTWSDGGKRFVADPEPSEDVKQLRGLAAMLRDLQMLPYAARADRGADALERLARERDELDAELNVQQMATGVSGEIINDLKAALAKAQAAVEQAFKDGIEFAKNVSVTDPDLAWQTSRARAALTAAPPTPSDGLRKETLLFAVQQLEAVLQWAKEKCPCENEQPNPCPLCGADANDPNGVCKAGTALPYILWGRVHQAVVSGRAALAEQEAKGKEG